MNCTHIYTVGEWLIRLVLVGVWGVCERERLKVQHVCSDLKKACWILLPEWMRFSLSFLCDISSITQTVEIPLSFCITSEHLSMYCNVESEGTKYSKTALKWVWCALQSISFYPDLPCKWTVIVMYCPPNKR